MSYAYDKALKSNARGLRNNMTKEEKKLWYEFLKDLPVTVKRQKTIGHYIVDFYIASSQLVIELDGVQHRTEEHAEADAVRDAYLTDLGMTILRYPNRAVNESFAYVCEDIRMHLSL